MELSGPAWVDRYPTSRSTGSLVEPFQTSVERFITALEAAGCTVKISATRRPAERAYLMRMAWDIARGVIRPELVSAREGVDIQWVHPSPSQSRRAAQQMVDAYRLAYRPSLTSRHIEGRAIDMSITRPGRSIEVVDGSGAVVRCSSWDQLYALGATYGVRKLISDPPHWSDDGR